MRSINQLLKFLDELEQKNIFYKIDRIRQESILIEVSVPGEHWEIEFMKDGTVQIEKYLSNGEIFDEREIEVLFQNFSD